MYRQAQTFSVAYYWVRVFSFAWPLSTPVFLHFALLYTQELNILKRKITYVILYLPAVLTSIADNIDPFTAGPVKAPWGFRIGEPQNILLFTLTTAWAGLLGIAAALFTWRFYLKTAAPEKKRQALLIGIGSSLTLIAGIITQVVIPLTGILIPEMTTALFAGLVVTIAIAVSRYRLFTVSPESASKEILSTMTDSLVLIDAETDVIAANRTTLDLLGYREDELLGKPVRILFKEEEKTPRLLQRSLTENMELKSYRTEYRKKSGDTVPVLFSVSDVRDKRGRVVGAIAIASDITGLIKAEEARRISDFLQNFLLNIPGRIEGIEFGHLYRSATETTSIGGDFFDIFDLKHGRAGIIIGDVSGKGLKAATLTSLARNTIKAYAYEDISPASVMIKTNDAVERTVSPGNFITVFFGIIDKESGLLTYCNAGHPPALVKSSDSILRLAANSTIIGAFPGLTYADDTVVIKKGDILLLYTDGIIEARHDSVLFGEERLMKFVDGLKSVTAGELPQLIFDEVMRFTNGKLLDDAAMLSLSLSNSEPGKPAQR